MQRAGLAGCLAIGLLAMGCASRGLSAPGTLPVATTVHRPGLRVHTDFYLPPRHRVLDELVQLRERMSDKLALPNSSASVHVYLFENRDAYLGYMRNRYTDFPDRRACFVASEEALQVFAYWGDRVAEDLRHEVAHGYLHAACGNLPLWLDEGLAEYFEGPAREAGRNPTHQEWFWKQAEQQTGWRPDLLRLEAADSPAQLTSGDYAEAWLTVHWLLHKDEATRRILRDYLRLLAESSEPPRFSAYLHHRRPGSAEEFERYAMQFATVR